MPIDFGKSVRTDKNDMLQIRLSILEERLKECQNRAYNLGYKDIMNDLLNPASASLNSKNIEVAENYITRAENEINSRKSKYADMLNQRSKFDALSKDETVSIRKINELENVEKAYKKDREIQENAAKKISGMYTSALDKMKRGDYEESQRSPSITPGEFTEINKEAVERSESSYGSRNPKIQKISDWGKETYNQVSKGYNSSMEENRIPKAVAWAKRELDKRASKIASKDASRAKDYIKKRKEELGVSKTGEERYSLEKEKKRIEMDIDSIDDEAKTSNNPNIGARLKARTDRLSQIKEEIQKIDQKYENVSAQFLKEAENQDFSAIYNEIIGKVPEVLEEAVKRFHLSVYGRSIVNEALNDFAKAEASELILKEKTIYSGAVKKASLRVGSFFDWWETTIVMDMLFSPITSGLLLTLGLAWISSLEIGIESLYDLTYVIILFAMVLLSALAAKK